MKKILGMYNINNTDDKLFFENLQNAVNILQEGYQEVEIQYSTNMLDDRVVLSALVIGRKDI